MKKMKWMLCTMMAMALCLPVFADVLVEDEPQPPPVEQPKVIPELKTHEKPRVVEPTKDIMIREVTEIDPSTQTYPICARCNGKIPPGRNYILTKEGKNYCSQTCFNADLPECTVCGKKLQVALEKEGYLFCSETCLSATWPVCQGCGLRSKVWKVSPQHNEAYCPRCFTSPQCHSCLRFNKYCKDLKDGRYICPTCEKSRIVDEKVAQQLLMEVYQVLRDKIGITPDVNGVKLQVVDVREIRAKTKYRFPGQEPGEVLKITNTQIKTEKVKDAEGNEKDLAQSTSTTRYEILILDNLSQAKFVETSAHELAVLWLEQNYNIGDPNVREGFGEWVAAQVNELYGRPNMNIRIQNNKDKTYGDGYRFVNSLIKKNGIEGFKQYLESLDNPDRP